MCAGIYTRTQPKSFFYVFLCRWGLLSAFRWLARSLARSRVGFVQHLAVHGVPADEPPAVHGVRQRQGADAGFSGPSGGPRPSLLVLGASPVSKKQTCSVCSFNNCSCLLALLSITIATIYVPVVRMRRSRLHSASLPLSTLPSLPG